jgi:hypothetical protein
MGLARHIIVFKVWTIIPSHLKQRTTSTEELSCFRQVLVVANTGSYGKCINSGLDTEAINGFVRSIQAICVELGVQAEGSRPPGEGYSH